MNNEFTPSAERKMKYDKDVSFDILKSVAHIMDDEAQRDAIREKLAEFKVDLPSEMIRARLKELDERIAAKKRLN